MFRRVLTASLVLVAVGVVVACGDDDDDATSATTTPAGEDVEEPGSSSTTGSVTGDATAEQPPDTGVEDEGLGDPLVLVAELSADAAVPGPGDDGAAGRIEIESAVVGEWCIDMAVTGLSSRVADSHVHFGTEGTSGDVVIPIGEPTRSEDGTATWTDVCVSVEDRLVHEVVDAPQAFHADVHTTGHPDGAVRGQLEPSSIFDLSLS